MSIEVGHSIPDATLGVMKADGPAQVQAQELLGSGRVVVFALPGAFTPTCSARHLPGFIEQAQEIRGQGVDRIVCLSVNDVFVMGAWGQHAGSGDQVVMAADGNADFTKALGLDLDASGFGMGTRSQRYAMIINNGQVEGLWIDPPGTFENSSAEAVLAHLRA
jgi:peroxiredoxin